MISQEKVQPRVVTNAVWCQLVIVGCHLATIGLYANGAVLYRRVYGGSDLPWPIVAVIPLMIHALWLLAGAIGLYRSREWAYRLSLVGLVLPLLGAALLLLVGVFGIGGIIQTIGRQYDQAAMQAWLDWQTLAAVTSPVLSLTALALMVATTGMLLTLASRRHFNH